MWAISMRQQESFPLGRHGSDLWGRTWRIPLRKRKLPGAPVLVAAAFFDIPGQASAVLQQK